MENRGKTFLTLIVVQSMDGDYMIEKENQKYPSVTLLIPASVDLSMGVLHVMSYFVSKIFLYFCPLMLCLKEG